MLLKKNYESETIKKRKPKKYKEYMKSRESRATKKELTEKEKKKFKLYLYKLQNQETQKYYEESVNNWYNWGMLEYYSGNQGLINEELKELESIDISSKLPVLISDFIKESERIEQEYKEIKELKSLLFQQVGQLKELIKDD